MRPLPTPFVALTALLAVSACEDSAEGVVELAHTHDARARSAVAKIHGLTQVLNSEGFAAGASGLIVGDEARLLLDYEGDLSDVRWAIEGGKFEADADGLGGRIVPADVGRLRVVVRATDAVGGALSAAFELPVTPIDGATAIVNPAATGVVTTGTDAYSSCRVVLDASDNPHIVFRDDTHSQLWYATFTGGAWVTEFVDGPGFAVGGAVTAEIDLAIDSAGVLHAVYSYDAGHARYARRQGGVWTLEQIHTSMNPTTPIAVALDPSNGNRPTTVFTDPSTAEDRPIVAYRTGTNAWTAATWSTAGYDDHATGGIAFTSTGTAWFTYDLYSTYAAPWTAAAGFGTAETLAGSYDEWRPLSMVNNQPLVLTSENMSVRTGSAAWSAYEWESVEPTAFDLATYANLPRMGVNHGGVELVQVDADGYFVYDLVDEGSSGLGTISVAVDSTGVTHACYERSDEIWFW